MKMEEVLSDLENYISNEDFANITKSLDKILSHSNETVLKKADLFQSLLKMKNNEILKLSTQLIAELAKLEQNRIILTNESLCKLLIPLLADVDCNIKLQSCRALGNICFENENARKLIGNEGLKNLISLMQLTLNCNAYDGVLISTSCGCLMNLMMGVDDLQKSAFDYGVLDVLEVILKHNLIDFEPNEDCTTHGLIIINMITEHMVDEWLSASLCNVIVDILRISVNPDISAMCLETLRMQCENDDIKLCLAKKGACELVYDLVEKHGNHVDDEDSRSILKMACDLIVLILTGDESMDFLYNNGQGKVYEQMISWLNSEDVDLLSTGVLAIGNFARNDSHCIQMVENGLAKKLLGILKYYSADGDTKVQHALLSTLRNLSIPSENKMKLLEENLVETLLSMLNINQSPVEFKLLGTLRMVVDGQEKTALDLITRKDFIEKLVFWCYNSDHLGVRGEAPRLLAWLIKNCHTANSYSTVLLVPNTIKCLVEMMSSMHVVMRNEALLALNLLCASCFSAQKKDDCDILIKQLQESEIGKNTYFILEKYCEKMEKESVENLITLLIQLVNKDVFLKEMRERNVIEVLKKLKSSENLGSVLEKITNLIDKIGST